MNKKKIIIIIGIAVIILAIILISIFKNSARPNNNPEQIEEKTYVQILSDGTKLNISEKLSRTRKIDGLELTNIRLIESLNVTQLLGTITNKTSQEKAESYIDATLIDQYGEEMVVLGIYVKSLKPGESTQVNASTTLDYSNAYDLKLTKNKTII